jgi:polysaccharide biosynthesis/export protein
MRWRRFWIPFLALSVFGILRCPILAQETSTGTQLPDEAESSVIAIGPGDLLDLTVFHVPELILKVRVDPRGFVSLPLIGDLKLAGMTVRDAQRAIALELVKRQLVNNPQVSVFIEEFATQGVTVYGEVNTPGIYSLMGPHTLFDAISAAGGLSLKAGRSVTILRAGHRDHEEVIDLTGPSGITNPTANVAIYPGDKIIVSMAGVVYVLGEVKQPGGFIIGNNTSMSLLKAIALAQGTTRVASLKHVIIIRKSSGTTVEIEVSLDKIYGAKAADMKLHPEDIVFIPLSHLKD